MICILCLDLALAVWTAIFYISDLMPVWGKLECSHDLPGWLTVTVVNFLILHIVHILVLASKGNTQFITFMTTTFILTPYMLIFNITGNAWYTSVAD